MITTPAISELRPGVRGRSPGCCDARTQVGPRPLPARPGGDDFALATTARLTQPGVDEWCPPVDTPFGHGQVASADRARAVDARLLVVLVCEAH